MFFKIIFFTIVDIFRDFEKGLQNLTFPVMFNPSTWEVHIFPIYFGGSVVKDKHLVAVPAVQLAYFLRADTKRQDAM